MITDLFPRERLTLAMAVYTLGATLGGGTAFMFGGALIEMISHVDYISVPIIGDVRSWQAVFSDGWIAWLGAGVHGVHDARSGSPRSAREQSNMA